MGMRRGRRSIEGERGDILASSNKRTTDGWTITPTPGHVINIRRRSLVHSNSCRFNHVQLCPQTTVKSKHCVCELKGRARLVRVYLSGEVTQKVTTLNNIFGISNQSFHLHQV